MHLNRIVVLILGLFVLPLAIALLDFAIVWLVIFHWNFLDKAE